jgi:hypothetical protein
MDRVHLSGVCHRCGWKAQVIKVHRVDRKRMGTGRDYGRLCDECVNHLVSTVSQLAGAPASARPRGDRHQGVA